MYLVTNQEEAVSDWAKSPQELSDLLNNEYRDVLDGVEVFRRNDATGNLEKLWDGVIDFYVERSLTPLTQVEEGEIISPGPMVYLGEGEAKGLGLGSDSHYTIEESHLVEVL